MCCPNPGYCRCEVAGRARLQGTSSRDNHQDPTLYSSSQSTGGHSLEGDPHCGHEASPCHNFEVRCCCHGNVTAACFQANACDGAPTEGLRQGFEAGSGCLGRPLRGESEWAATKCPSCSGGHSRFDRPCSPSRGVDRRHRPAPAHRGNHHSSPGPHYDVHHVPDTASPAEPRRVSTAGGPRTSRSGGSPPSSANFGRLG